jgi:signal transduction histidine kinase
VQLLDPISQPAAIEHLQRRLRCEAVPCPPELLARSCDGREAWLEVNASPIIRDGEPSGTRGTARDITERKAAERRAQEATEREVVLRERQRIAQELHDNVAQYFFSIGMAASSALASQRATSAELRERITRIWALSVDGGKEIREAIHALQDDPPPDLDAAIEALFEPLRADAIEIRYSRTGDTAALPKPALPALVSIAREFLFNVRKHANATHVLVTVRIDGTATSLSVADDGIGEAARIEREVAQGACFGLRNMRTRLRAMGGELAWQNNDGAGVRVTATVPHGDNYELS